MLAGKPEGITPSVQKGIGQIIAATRFGMTTDEFTKIVQLAGYRAPLQSFRFFSSITKIAPALI